MSLFNFSNDQKLSVSNINPVSCDKIAKNVCSLYLKPNDLRKSVNGGGFVRENEVFAKSLDGRQYFDKDREKTTI